MPSPNSALSSNSEFDQAGPRPSASARHGVVGRLPPKIEEHPVALATRIRSPNIWVSSFRYGVSPQPEHAPENSKSGSRSCEPFTDAMSIVRRSGSGIPRKKSQLARSSSRWSSRGSMLIALCLTSSFDFAGHTSTHTAQPVQSSGATWIVMRWSSRSRDRKGSVLNVSGAPARSSAGKALRRIAACGHTIVHLAHWMQISGSKIGISRAMPRRSYCVVPVGNVPSTGRALTGRRSPASPSIMAVTRFTKSGLSAGTTGRIVYADVASAGTSILASEAMAASTAAWLRSSTTSPNRA